MKTEPGSKMPPKESFPASPENKEKKKELKQTKINYFIYTQSIQNTNILHESRLFSPG
jgi:hypothetical protein